MDAQADLGLCYSSITVKQILFVCVGVLRPSQQRGVMSSWSVNSGIVPGQA